MIDYAKLMEPNEDEMDDADWDEWMKLSEEEIDRRVQSAERQYFEWLDSLTPDQRYRYDRKRAVENCIRWRKVCRSAGLQGGYWTSLLRERQMRLLKLRIWRMTGVYPGSG